MKPSSPLVAVDWTRAKSLLSDLKTSVSRSLVLQILMGRELASIKVRLGFVNGRNQRVGHDVQPSQTWAQWCERELDGLQRRTADRWIGCFHAAVERAKRHKNTHPEALQLLEAEPAGEPEAYRSLLADHVEVLLAGELFSNEDGTPVTQRQLLEELGIAKGSSKRNGGDTSQANRPFEQLAAEAWAEAFFSGISRKLDAVKREILRTRDGVDYRFRLKELPLTPDPEDRERPCLQGIKTTLEEVIQGELVKVIRDVDAEIEARRPAAMKIPRKTPTKSTR